MVPGLGPLDDAIPLGIVCPGRRFDAGRARVARHPGGPVFVRQVRDIALAQERPIADAKEPGDRREDDDGAETGREEAKEGVSARRREGGLGAAAPAAQQGRGLKALWAGQKTLRSKGTYRKSESRMIKMNNGLRYREWVALRGMLGDFFRRKEGWPKALGSTRPVDCGRRRGDGPDEVGSQAAGASVSALSHRRRGRG